MDKQNVRAKIDLMLTNPFWGSLVTRLELRDWEGDTFATNGKILYCPDPKYYDPKWTFQNIIFIIAHETFHCAGGHIFRKGVKEHRLWNVAADFATNALLKENGFALPANCLYDKKYNGMTAEKIYGILFEEKEKDKDAGDKEGGTYGNPHDILEPSTNKSGDGEGDSPATDPRELEQEWKEGTASAARIAKGRGNLPSGLEEYINQILFPKVAWYEILYRHLQTSKGHNDYCSYPFNRKHIWREMYLPSLRGESIELICAVDSSGSISSDDFIRYFSEMRGIASIFGNYKIHFMVADADVHQYEVIDEDSPMPTMVVGRGGTDFRPVFDRIEKEELHDLPIVYFTDLDGSFPDKWDGNDVFWLIRKEQNRYSHDVPFGKVIEIDD